MDDVTLIQILIDNLVVGGHCGLCGEWVDKAIVPVYWQWTICPKCAAPNNASNGLAGTRQRRGGSSPTVGRFAAKDKTMKPVKRSFSLRDLREQCSEVARKFNQGQPVELIEVFSLLEQLVIQLDESQFPAEHQHEINLKSGGVVIK